MSRPFDSRAGARRSGAETRDANRWLHRFARGLGTTGTVADYDLDTGNPANVAVSGEFVPLNGHGTYVLTCTGVAGSSGSLPVTCKTVLGKFSCDGPTEVELLAG